MKPIIISVDTEFTDGDLLHGQCMSVAFVSDATGRVGQWLLPITTDAQVNHWVHENLPNLVMSCLQISVMGNHLPDVHTARDGRVSGAMAGQVQSMVAWLEEDKKKAYWMTLEDNTYTPMEYGEKLPSPEDYDPPLVMLTYCGGYDFGFITLLFNRCGLHSPFHHESIEIATLAYAVLDMGWDIDGEKLAAELGMEPNPNAHDALSDAKHQLAVFRELEVHRRSLHDS